MPTVFSRKSACSFTRPCKRLRWCRCSSVPWFTATRACMCSSASSNTACSARASCLGRIVSSIGGDKYGITGGGRIICRSSVLRVCWPSESALSSAIAVLTSRCRCMLVSAHCACMSLICASASSRTCFSVCLARSAVSVALCSASCARRSASMRPCSKARRFVSSWSQQVSEARHRVSNSWQRARQSCASRSASRRRSSARWSLPSSSAILCRRRRTSPCRDCRSAMTSRSCCSVACWACKAAKRSLRSASTCCQAPRHSW
mmetsp:Transcript_16285/g.42092  ORF Transcript_16285/g.42092 Transcript_16285/m.42092 type:complete len:262 (+) Transcript_16285:74-859(+)